MEPTSRLDEGFAHPLARPVLLFGWIMMLVAALVGRAVPDVRSWSLELWLTILAITVTFLVVTVRRPGRLRWPYVVLLMAVSFATVIVLLFPWTDVPLDTKKYAFGFLNMGISFLILRGRPVAGTISSLMVLAGLLGWGIGEGRDVIGLLKILAQPLVTLIAFLLFYLIGRAIAGRPSRVVNLQLAVVTETDEARSNSSTHLQAMREIRALVEPLLKRISDGELLTPEFHLQLMEADEIVRTYLRGDVPVHDDFLQAVSMARKNKVMVRVVGNENSSSPMSDALAKPLSELLLTNGIKEAVIRFSPPSRGGMTTILIEGPEGTCRYEFDPQGNLMREPA